MTKEQSLEILKIVDDIASSMYNAGKYEEAREFTASEAYGLFATKSLETLMDIIKKEIR